MQKKGVLEKCYLVAVALFTLMGGLFQGNQAHALEKEIVNSLGMEFVLIPAGTFMMGTNIKYVEYPGSDIPDDYMPAHQVTISKPFYMSKYEVTQAQWAMLMSKNLFEKEEQFIKNYPPTPTPYDAAQFIKKATEQLKQTKGNNKPVVYVSWKDAQEFIHVLNKKEGKKYRLPTEAEWEYAARAGTTTLFYWGEDREQLNEYAWNSFNSESDEYGHIHPVGQLKPNAWGLYDMLGNVWEICQDWYKQDYYQKSPAVDPQGPASGERKEPCHVIRGGSYRGDKDTNNVVTRSYMKRGDRGDESTGFRLVLEP